MGKRNQYLVDKKRKSPLEKKVGRSLKGRVRTFRNYPWVIEGVTAAVNRDSTVTKAFASDYFDSIAISIFIPFYGIG